jgi:hypothetical protein
MLKIRIKGQKELRVIPSGHDTRLSEDGKTLAVMDKDGELVDGVALDPASVVAVVRE